MRAFTSPFRLLSGSSMSALATAAVIACAAPAFAQAADAPAPAAAADAEAAPAEIVVTGTLFRNPNANSAAPVTVLTNNDLNQRGITNVADAIRSVSADNSGSIPTAFSNGFGSGSAAVSLRGLTVNSTLVLINGVRTANYPYADDGQRSFVDLNSIPRSTIDHIEVLKEGASSIYGADAIGGVVNIITRREIRGIEGTAEGGISQRGDGAEQRVTLTAGWGSLAEQGFNFYINGEYEHDSLITASERGFPYNNADLTSIGGDNNNPGAFGAFGTRLAPTTAVVRPATVAQAGNIFSGTPIPGGLTQILGGSCAPGQITHNDDTGAYCEQNVVPYGTLQPRQDRYGLTAHGSFNYGSDGKAYIEGTWYHSKVFSTSTPFTVRQRNPINTTNVVLPAILANGALNPYNPYAVAGCVEGVSCVDAQLSYAFGDRPVTTTTNNDLYRVAAGASGTIGNGFEYNFDATYARSRLKGVNTGYINIAGLTDAINNGTYNFINPAATPASVVDSILQPAATTAHSSLFMAQGSIGKDLVDLPGGALKVAVGGSVRHETLNNPNANATQATLGLNAVTAAGKHWVEAIYGEIDAPVLDILDLNASGRYDHYSEGYSHFSPKIEARLKPIKEVALRGTYSRGFRAPTFAEINQGAVIGYTSATPPCSVIIQHGGTGDADNCSGGNAYVKQYSLGFNSTANPNIKPELSRSFTGGAVFQPTNWFTVTVDYYNIKKTRVISGGPLSNAAIAAFYANTPLPDGYTVVTDDPDPLFPNATPKVVQVNAPYANAGALKTQGIDVQATAQFRLGAGAKWTSSVDVTDIFKFDFNACTDKGDPNCATQHWVGTQAPYVLSSGAGTPKWRGSWENTLQLDKLTVSGTVYYTSGYKAVAEDQNGVGATSCADNLYDGSLPDFYCHTKRFIDVDLTGSYKVSDKFTFYVNVLNLFDAKAPLNPANYAGAGANYNPTWSQQGIIGRFVRFGANFKF